MADMKRIEMIICDEIEKIADRGLTTSNLDTAYKLIDMYKDLKTVEGMDEYANYEYANRSRKRDSMGRYSMMYDGGNSYNSEHKYMDSKRAYRTSHSQASKESMLDDLDAFMDEMHGKLKELKRDADTPEERETIDKYIKMLERI